MPDEDLPDMVEILHHISLREKLHTIKLMSPTKNLDVAIKIFGINPLFNATQAKPLLEQLNGTGTLFIQNIHFLDLETQQSLAHFIKSGSYAPLKSDQRSYSDVRILCSAHRDLQTLVQEGVLAESLYNELKITISEPSLLSLSDKEFTELTKEYVEQAVQTQTLKNFFELTEREKTILLQQRPGSLRHLKERVQNILVQKSKKKHIYHETYFNPAYNIADPELAEAVKLGKHALRDQKIMNMLWHKFKNQNKIATLLGVNRSSVYRRCKDFNLG
jgi:DNA-binding NtrC family response regulator